MAAGAVKTDKLGSKVMQQAVTTGGAIKPGTQMKAVKYLERALKLAGFNPGATDQKFDASTAKAIKLFQKAWGLPVTGELDQSTLTRLNNTVDRARKSGSIGDAPKKPGLQGAIGVGQKNKDVFSTEQRLKKLGYDVGKVDGVFDQQLAAAVKEFKADEGLKANNSMVGEKTSGLAMNKANSLDHKAYRGRVTRDLKQHRRLDSATKAAAGKSNAAGQLGIGEGSSKRAIMNVQSHLKSAGFDPGVVDGKYDARTQAMVERFQRKAGIKPSGRVGPKTWGKLEKSQFEAKSGTSPAQKLGEKSGAVKNTEKLLKKLGYKVKVDGIFDRQTQQASRKFEERINGTGDNGAIGKHQIKRMKQVLRAKQNPGKGPTLKKGYRGQPVKILQRRLEQMGFDVGKVDGDFGNKTRSAVKRFQKTFGLGSDGVVGPKTWRMLAVKSKGKVNKPGSAGGGGGSISAGGAWGGSQGVTNAATAIAASMGIPLTSIKRNLADTIRVGSNTGSDHYTGNTTAYAADFGVSGSRAETLARAIASKYGIPVSNIGTFNSTYKVINGVTYKLQLLWRVAGHYDHVHLGVRRA